MDRPGYGNSDPNRKKRSLKDLAADLDSLAQHLNIARFALVGVSGGGPMAAACAHYLGHKVTALSLICAVPPPAAIKDGSLANLVRLGRWPAIGRPTLNLARGVLRTPARAEAAIFGRQLPGRDNAIMTRTRRTALLAAVREGLRTGVDGALADAMLYGQHWDFRLEDIKVPTTIWHGDDDHLVPVASAHAYAAIPNSVLRILKGEGHYSLALGKTEMMMTDLLARAAITQ
jgi:pimeloyl-ACP methyl ester carboxylesterase